MSVAYLDYNAGAPVRPEVVDAMVQALRQMGNPSSVHGPGRAARAMVEQARRQVAELLDVDPAWVVFTSGGTEANNMVLQGWTHGPVLLSDLEHPSVRDVREDGMFVPVQPNGMLDLQALEQILGNMNGPALLCLMAANNETGIIQPVAEAARICAERGILLHCDMAQLIGREVVSLANVNVAFATVSAHKLGGPSGIGAGVVLKSHFHLAPILRGGGQERRRRSGTENVAGIVGFGMAAHMVKQELAAGVPGRIRDLRDRMEARAKAMVPAVQVVGETVDRLCNTCCLILPGVPSQVQVMALDLAGIAVSAGSACSSGKVASSPVLRAMGYGSGQADAALRVSLGPGTEWNDIERFLAAWAELARRKGFEVQQAA